MTDKILVGIITFIAGGFVKHLWDRFINRITTIRYNVWHQYLGTSSDNPLFGSVKVLYNETPVKSLFTSMVTISNDGNRDLSDLELNIVCDARSAILISHGMNRASLNELLFTDNYFRVLSENKPENYGYIFGRRDYKLPVLNRGDRVEILLLTTNFDAREPQITVSCDHPGVKMKFQKQAPQILFGESQQQSAIVGLFIAVAICYFLTMSSLSLATAVWIAFGLGAFAAFFGVLAIKLFKYLRRIF